MPNTKLILLTGATGHVGGRVLGALEKAARPVEMLLRPENRDQLVAVLTYHVVPGKVMAV